jgi:response regulator RpfG family c-di-GMP phosphodiesterase
MKPAVLLVDDEPAILDGLARHLRGEFDLCLASSGGKALDAMRTSSFAVVVSDLQMPGLDGIGVLSHAQDLVPDAVRVLLTGRADVESATKAVNLGQVFRFLVKPVPAKDLGTILRSAVRQHQSQAVERDVLEQTLRGSVQILLDTLALANPVAFARATRVQRLVIDILDVLEVTDRWHIEVAAALIHVGAVTLPVAVAEKMHAGIDLRPDEAALADQLPTIADRLLESIPRLDPVRAIIRCQGRAIDDGSHFAGQYSNAPFGARVLHVALDTDAICAAGTPLAKAVEILEARPSGYDGAVLRALHLVVARQPQAVRLIGVAELVQHMVVTEDVVDSAGRLLVGAGQRVSESLIDRVRNFHDTIGVSEPLHVFDAPTNP